MTKRIPHTCPNCKHSYVDSLTLMKTWWCKNPKTSFGEVGYTPKTRCRKFEPEEVG